MNDDMRLKSIVVKGPKVGIIPCLKTCDKAAKCLCEELRKLLEGKSPSDISCLEMEWIHVPKHVEVSVWVQWVFMVVTVVLLLALLVPKGCSSTQSNAKLKVSLSENGYVVECRADSVETFEKMTNDIERIKRDLQIRRR